MPWTVKNPPSVAKNWTKSEKEKCVKAANAVLAEGKPDKDAIFACIHAAGKSKNEEKSAGFEYKSIAAQYEIPEGDEGIVKHLISLYGIIDDADDIAHKGMFAKTISERKSDIAVVDTHRRDSILAAIGLPISFEEVDRDGLPEEVKNTWPDATGGLIATTQFLLDTPEGLGAYARIKAGAVSSFSYAFKALDYDYELKGRRRVRNLRTVKMREYGPCLFAINPGATVLGYKAYKAQSLTSVVDAVGEAFYQQVVQEVPSYSPAAYVREVFDGYAVVEQDGLYFKVPYELQEDKYTFEADSDKWIAGKYEFVPNAESDEKTETYEEDLLQLQLQLLGLELKSGPL